MDPTTKDVIAFWAVQVAAFGAVFTLLVSIVSLVISVIALRQARSLELAKLSSILWEKQAAFAQDFFPKLREFLDTLAETGVKPDDRAVQKVNAVRNSILAHGPFLPKGTEEGLLEVVVKFRNMIARSSAGEALGPALPEIRAKVYAEASDFLIDLVAPKSIEQLKNHLRDLLHTDELTQARTRALGKTRKAGR